MSAPNLGSSWKTGYDSVHQGAVSSSEWSEDPQAGQLTAKRLAVPSMLSLIDRYLPGLRRLMRREAAIRFRPDFGRLGVVLSQSTALYPNRQTVVSHFRERRT